MPKLRTIVVLLIIAGAGIGAGAWLARGRAPGPTSPYRTVSLTRGDLAATITATGTVEPRDVVDVGAQVAGIIVSFGKDPQHPDQTIDYRSQVDVGTILCQIDPSLYQADVDAASASLQQANATLEKMHAALQQLSAKVKQTTADWNRARAAQGSISQSDYDAAEANYETATSSLSMGNADVDQGVAGVAAAKAALDRANRNVGYCTVTSPVKGEIIDRRVNIGQTVVSSLSAPSLFLIAKDLSRVQVWASVNEADIGRITPGQSATFTVDAHPERMFHGTVGKIRLNATMTQNVVTYTVEIDTANDDRVLLPYMTANITFNVARRTGVLLASNAALRWTPKEDEVAPEDRERMSELLKRREMEAAGLSATQPSDNGARSAEASSGVLWVADGAVVRPVEVRVGVTDGTTSEVYGENISEGMDVIVGEQREAGGDNLTNPFMPQFGQKKQ